jgi:hypothetical protein
MICMRANTAVTALGRAESASGAPDTNDNVELTISPTLL